MCDKDKPVTQPGVNAVRETSLAFQLWVSGLLLFCITIIIKNLLCKQANIS